MNFEEWAKNSKWNFDSSEYAKEIKSIAKAAWEAAWEACPYEENADQQRNAITKRYKVLETALETVKAVLESDDPAIADTVWVPGGIPETLLDHVCAALDAYNK